MARLLLVFLGTADALPFTPGNILALRSYSTAALTSAATVVVLDELPCGATNAAAVQNISIPSNGTNACTCGGSSSVESKVTLSPDGLVATFPCYNASVGTSSVAATTSPRLIGVVLANGTLGNSIPLGSGYSAMQYRSSAAASAAGPFYTSGLTVGSYYVPPGGTSVQLSTVYTNTRSTLVALNASGLPALYIGTSSSGGLGQGVYSVCGAGSGCALPTSGNTTYTRITTDTTTSVIYPAAWVSPDSFVFESGASRLWLTDASANATYWGVWRFPWNASSGMYEPTSAADRVWSGAACLGLAGQPESGTFTLYFACGASSASAIYRMPVGGAPPYTAATVIQAPANSYYRGVSFVPGTLPSKTPSPTQSSTASSTPTTTPAPSPILSCDAYSGSGSARDPCCRGLAYLYRFGAVAGDSVQTKAANGHYTKNWSGTAFKFFGTGAWGRGAVTIKCCLTLHVDLRIAHTPQRTQRFMRALADSFRSLHLRTRLLASHSRRRL